MSQKHLLVYLVGGSFILFGLFKIGVLVEGYGLLITLSLTSIHAVLMLFSFVYLLWAFSYYQTHLITFLALFSTAINALLI